MKRTVETISETRIAYMRRVGAYGIENYQLMEQFKSWARNKQLLTPGSVIYGIAQDNPEVTPPNKCRYDVGIVMSKDFESDAYVHESSISSGKYLVFEIEHTVESVERFWLNFPALLKESQNAYDVTRVILERYKSSLVATGYCEFLVPIK